MDFQSLLTSPLVPYETLPGKPFTGRCIVSSPVDISKGVVEAIRRGAEKYCAREGWAEELDFLSSNSPHAFVNKCLEHFLVNYDVSMPMPTKKAFAAKLATYLHEAPATQGTNV